MRREFISALGEAAVWPLAGHAQQSERMRRLGVLISWSERDPGIQAFVTAFVQALERLGLVEGKNIQIDQRSAAGDAALFKSYAAELVGLSPDVIFATSAPSVAALQHQTRTIPIVLAFVPDPVGLGFVQSLAQPGGNITGFSGFDPALMGKWLQLLKGIAARVTQVSVIFNPETTPYAPLLNRSIEDAAPSSRVAVSLIPVRDDTAIEEAISNLAREPGGGLIALPDSFNVAHRDVIIAAAIRHRLPAMGLGPLFSRGGGRGGPGRRIRAGGILVDRILRGANPPDLPVQYPTKYSLIINLKTAKTLGLTVPPSMLDLADEVIE